jgi:hypothetical protein
MLASQDYADNFARKGSKRRDVNDDVIVDGAQRAWPINSTKEPN